MPGLQAMVRKQDREAVEVMVDNGVKILAVPETEVEQFKGLAAKALQKTGQNVVATQTVDEIKKLLADYRQGRKP